MSAKQALAPLEQERQRYVEALERVASALPSIVARLPEVERVWLFGSYVREWLKGER